MGKIRRWLLGVFKLKIPKYISVKVQKRERFSMRLEEFIFCTLFFLAPVVGMVGMVIKSVLKGLKQEEISSHKQLLKERLLLNKKKKAIPAPAFVGDRRGGEVLIKAQVHMPTKLNQFKEDNHPRAGPITST